MKANRSSFLKVLPKRFPQTLSKKLFPKRTHDEELLRFKKLYALQITIKLLIKRWNFSLEKRWVGQTKIGSLNGVISRPQKRSPTPTTNHSMLRQHLLCATGLVCVRPISSCPRLFSLHIHSPSPTPCRTLVKPQSPPMQCSSHSHSYGWRVMNRRLCAMKNPASLKQGFCMQFFVLPRSVCSGYSPITVISMT